MNNMAVRSIGSDDRKAKLKDTLLLIGFSTVIAFLILMVCSRSSFLYPFNDWVDANCFFTMGKSVANGKVLYRDVFDHKGPLLYFIYVIPYWISKNTFLGVFIIEIIAGAITIFCNIKTMMLYTQKWFSLFSATICSIITYSCLAFSFGGGAEELCLPIFAYCLYLSARAFRTGEYFSKRQLICVGIISGMVLWIKYVMLGFFIGWIIVPFIWLISQKKWKKIVETILFVGTGVIITTLPIIIYFALNNSLPDLFEVYFYDNMFIYTQNVELKGVNDQGVYDGFLIPMIRLVSSMFADITIVIGTVIFGIIGFLFLGNKKEKLNNIFCLGVMVVLMFGSGKYITYYALPIASFNIFGFIALGLIAKRVVKHFKLDEKFKDNKKANVVFNCISIIASLVLSVPLSFMLSNNVEFMSVKQEDLPQFKFKEIICKTENATLLEYGCLDVGVYTVCDIVPTEKYFYRSNLVIDDMDEKQKEYIDNGRVDFVVTLDLQLEDAIANNNYELALENACVFEGEERIFRLYELKK